ncbi:MAG: hypothetical protein COB51_06900 [Moraxellaceae bacterium]|nr:MAG: hypothetical protein COB51_06900 [Moraxellaceae bacterium]
MNPNEIALLLNSYSAAIANETSLWTMYVAATFAAAGFGINSTNLSNFKMAAFAVIGFLAFAVGQFWMVSISHSKREIIQGIFECQANTGVDVFLQSIVAEGVGRLGAIATHLFINSCVIAILLYRSITIKYKGENHT